MDLPAPPGPVIVTTRCSRSSAATWSRSRWRPISRLRAAGSAEPAGCAGDGAVGASYVDGDPATSSSSRSRNAASGSSTPSSRSSTSAIRSSACRASRRRPCLSRSRARSTCASSSSGSSATSASKRPAALSDLAISKPQQVTCLLRPRLVEVLGQQWAGVEGGCRCGGLRVAHVPRRGHRPLEPCDVDLDRLVREQRDDALRHDDAPRVAEGRAGVVRRRVQPGRAGVERHVGPERVDDLLAVEPVRRLEGQQLHEPARGLPPPAPGRDRSAVDDDLEPSEQPYLDAHHPPRPPVWTPAAPGGPIRPPTAASAKSSVGDSWLPVGQRHHGVAVHARWVEQPERALALEQTVGQRQPDADPGDQPA